MKNEQRHRIRITVARRADGSLGVALPAYGALVFDFEALPERDRPAFAREPDAPVAFDAAAFEAGALAATAWVSVPASDCSCSHADEAAWHAHLDAKYAERAGEFRPSAPAEHEGGTPVFEPSPAPEAA